jgi:ABC-type nickel/cobalt efflux system permease component RcnA
VALVPGTASITYPPGLGGLATLRLECGYEARLATRLTGPTAISFADESYAERIGWREIVVVGDGVDLAGDDLASQSISDRLTAYPEDLLSTPLDVGEVAFTATPDPSSALPSDRPANGGAPVGGPAAVPGTAAVPGGIPDDVSTLIGARDLSPLAIIGTLLLAAGLGAGHALSPGHGKTVMAAYLVGSRGTARHALGLGLTVTVSHTLGVFGLAAVTLAASSQFPPDRIYPLLQLISGLIVVAIGSWLLLVQVRAFAGRRRMAQEHTLAGVNHASESTDHDHEHGRHQRHDHEGTDHHHEGADHHHEGADHHHEGADHHHHQRPGHAPQEHDHPHNQDEAHEPDARGEHSHGGIRHRHLPPAGTTLSWRSLVSLGLAGGLVPSVPALLILVGSLQAQRPAYGLILVVAFGAGMAVVLGGVGLAVVYARRLVERASFGPALPLIWERLPLATAVVVIVAGLFLTQQSLVTVF